jgi:uncharacterized protein
MPNLIQRTADHVQKLLAGEGTGHDWFHIERVRHTALRIGREEGAVLVVVELAAIMRPGHGQLASGSRPFTSRLT